MNLYELSENYKALFDSLEELEGDEEGEQAWFDTLEMLEDEFSGRAENIAAYIKQLGAEAEVLRSEEKRLAERRRVKERRAERLKAYLLSAMQAMGLSKLDCPMAKISVRSNAESVRIPDEDAFIEWAQENAAQLLRYKRPDIDKTAVRRFIQLCGGIDVAELVRTQSVVIK